MVKKSNAHESDLKILMNAPVGRSVWVDGNRYIVKRFNGMQKDRKPLCMSCVFRDGCGARLCKYARACMAHLRPDRESVYFGKEGV